jgi:hypothetical protein
MLCKISFITALIPFMREEPSEPNHLLEIVSFTTIQLGMKFHYEFWRENFQTIPMSVYCLGKIYLLSFTVPFVEFHMVLYI